MDDWKLYREPDLDIVVYFKVSDQKSLRALNTTNQEVFDQGMELDTEGYHLSLFKIPAETFVKNFPEYKTDADHATVLRSVFMKEEHEEFVDELIERLIV